ncbi:cupin domain-containing protein [Sphingomonas sp. IW22]|uniref:cupin domain-containing protein n=1 Tax=Sphingomonas sp. IW22 TaxID=3242489 RepID=UPI00352189C9
MSERRDSSGNLLSHLPDARAGEVFADILRRPGCRIERIVSHGQVTPPKAPYCQDHDEWVLVLSGRAIVEVAGRQNVLMPGDHLFIPRRAEHRVTHTDLNGPTVWLAVHIGEGTG